MATDAPSGVAGGGVCREEGGKWGAHCGWPGAAMARRSASHCELRQSCCSTSSMLERMEYLSKWNLSTSRPSTTAASAYAVISAGTTPAEETAP